MVGVPLALLLLIETGLRLAGYGYRTSFFKPLEIGGRPMLVENDKFGWRFFPRDVARSPAPVVMPAVKPPDTYRIFVLGESAALGDPRPAFGFSRYLEVLLRDRLPNARFEVVNVSMTAISSHAIREIARDCAGRQGDLWIVYAGNNEYYGPFGARSVFGARTPPLPLVRAQLLLQRFRLGQLLDSLVDRLLDTADTDPGVWAGLRMFVGHPLAPSSPARAVVQRNFARNLAAILRTGTDSGAKIIVAGMVVNLADCPPFASAGSPGMAPDEQEAWSKLYRSAAVLQDTGDRAGALPLLQVAVNENPDHAETRFRLAEVLLADGDTVGAAKRFNQARDLDALPVRADSPIIQASRKLARDFAARGVTWLDVSDALSTPEKAGLPGNEAFHEHVHLTFTGNYRLARAVADQVYALLPDRLKREAAVDWADQELAERRLGLTDWNRSEILQGVVSRLLDAPYTNQLHAAERLQRLSRQLNRLRERMDPDSKREAAALYEAAIQQAPEDHRLYENQAEFRELTGDLAGAVQDWERVQKLLPHHFSGWYHAGRLLRQLDRPEASRQALAQALALRPDLAEAHLELASLDIAANRLDEALAHCRAAIRLRPNQARPRVLEADILARIKRPEEALASLREAIRVQPSDWEAHYLLGVEMAVQEKLPEAVSLFAKAVRLKPGHALSHLNLGIALARQARFDEAMVHFQEVLRLDPVNQQALNAMKMIETMQRRAKQAEGTAAEPRTP
jgi:tetratricopeptide (TPR) repeat protein